MPAPIDTRAIDAHGRGMTEAAAAVTELEGWSPRKTGHLLEDGTPVTAWLRFGPDGAVATDRGETLSQKTHLSPGLRAAIRAVCRNNDVQIDAVSICLPTALH